MGRQLLKHNARLTMREPRSPNLFLVTIVYMLIVIVLNVFIQYLTDWGRFTMDMQQEYINWYDGGEFGEVAFSLTVSGVAFFVLGYLFQWLMELGYIYYARGVVNREELGFRSLFEGFNYLPKYLLVRVIYTVAVAVGMIFFIFPGIMAMCAFSQVYLLLLDEPERGVFWCFRESIRLMRGKKWQYFVLRLSFIGWELLQIVPVIGYAASVWAVPYMQITFVNYYNVLTGRDSGDPRQGWERPGMF